VLTKEQADRVVQKLSELVEKGGCPALEFGFREQGFGHGPPGPLEPGIVPGGFAGTDLMETAADYLVLDGADLREALGDGKAKANVTEALELALEWRRGEGEPLPERAQVTVTTATIPGS
jgi:hypothetical protein